jgi:Flp pilus assembly protein TadG
MSTSSLFIRSIAGRFLRDRRGVAATEFALIMPILFISYLMVFEVTLAIETRQKADRIGSVVADLVAQQQSLSKADIAQILEISETIIRPYDRSNQTVKVTAIQVSDEVVPKATVSWSVKSGSTPGTVVNGDTPKNAPATPVPAKLMTRGAFVIQVTTDLRYLPVIVWSTDAKETLGILSAFSELDFDGAYYARPRQAQTVTCSDCAT